MLGGRNHVASQLSVQLVEESVWPLATRVFAFRLQNFTSVVLCCGCRGITGGSKDNICVKSLTFYLQARLPVSFRNDGLWRKAGVVENGPAPLCFVLFFNCMF